MVRKSDLEVVIAMQKEQLDRANNEIQRELLSTLPEETGSHALIISGVRRCGKSTLIKQMIRKDACRSFFINFDTPKLYNFDINDFEILDLVIAEAKPQKLYFDEIQVVDSWELYVRQKLDEGFQVIVT